MIKLHNTNNLWARTCLKRRKDSRCLLCVCVFFIFLRWGIVVFSVKMVCGAVTVLDAVRQVERHTAKMHTRDEGIYYKNASTWNKLFLFKRIVSIVHCNFVWPACGHNETSSINRTEENRRRRNKKKTGI